MSETAKRELTHESSVHDKLRALIDASETFNADLTSIIARDDDDKVIGCAVCCTDDDAVALARWVERRKDIRRTREQTNPEANSGARSAAADRRRGKKKI